MLVSNLAYSFEALQQLLHTTDTELLIYSDNNSKFATHVLRVFCSLYYNVKMDKEPCSNLLVAII